MDTAYADSSALVAIAFNQARGVEIFQRLTGFDRLVSSNLLEAEVRSAYAREGRGFEPDVLDRIEWVYPIRPLTPDFATVLATGYLRGADLWHVAVALYTFAGRIDEVTFLTLDHRQRTVAAVLGFRT